MGNINVIFTFEGRDIAIQCTKEDQMRDICRRLSIKLDENINSLLFLYGGDKVNFDLSLIEQANQFDKEKNEMRIFVYRNEKEDKYACPKCGAKIDPNIFKKYQKDEKKVEDLKKTIKMKDEKVAILEESNKSLLEMLDEKKKVVNVIKSYIPFDIKEGDKLMCVIFMSGDGKVHHPIICKNTQKFNEVENLLYSKFPDYKETENYFLVNGIRVNKAKTLEENKIGDEQIISLYINDF